MPSGFTSTSLVPKLALLSRDNLPHLFPVFSSPDCVCDPLEYGEIAYDSIRQKILYDRNTRSADGGGIISWELWKWNQEILGLVLASMDNKVCRLLASLLSNLGHLRE